MKCLISKLNILRRHKLNDINILIAVTLSAIFLGVSRNEDDITRALFFMPIITYLYSYIIIKKPLLLGVYLITFLVSKRISDKSR